MEVLLLAVGKDASPYGLADILAFLKQHQVDVDLLNLRGSLDGIRSIQSIPRIVGISAYTTVAPLAKTLCGMVRKRWPHSKIVVGGRHFCEDTIKHEGKEWQRIANHIIIGDGEHAMLKITSGEIGQTIIYGQALSAIEFRTLPMPPAKIVNRQFPMKFNEILFSRGCPYRCTYCGSIRQKVIHRRPESAAEYLARHGHEATMPIHVADDVFTSDYSWLKEFVECYRRAHLMVPLRCFIHGRTFDAELLDLLKQVNIKQVSLGAESGNDVILNRINKGTTTEDYRRIHSLVKANGDGIDLHCLWMLGNVGETDATMQDTVRLAGEIGTNQSWASFAIPFPGTQFWKQALTAGKIQTWDFGRWHNRELVFVPNGCSAERMKRYRKEIMNENAG